MQTAPATLAILALAAFGSLPQGPQDPKPTSPNHFVIEAGEHTIKDLIDRTAEFLKRNYIYSAQEVDQLGPEASIKIQNRLDLGRTEVETVVSQLLYTRNFAMLPVNEPRGIYEWVSLAGQKRTEIDSRPKQMTVAEVMAYVGPKMPVITTYTLQNIQAPQAQNTLRPFFVSGGGPGPSLSFGIIGNANALLIRGFSDQVAAAVKLLQRTDGAAPDTEDFYVWKERIEKRVEALEQKVK